MENVENVELTQEQVKVFEEIGVIKELKKRVDGLGFIISSPTISPTPSMEKINAYTSLMMVKGWLQEVLEVNGQSQIQKVEIHVITDVNDDIDVSDPLKVQVKKINANGESTLFDANELESLNHVRTDINNILRMVSEISLITDNIYETFIYQHLKEVKFWMDRQLFFMKKENKRKHFEHANPGIKGQFRTPPVGKKAPLIINKPRIEPLKPEQVQEKESVVEEATKEVTEKVKEEAIEQTDESSNTGKVIQMIQPEVEETRNLDDITDEELFGKDHKDSKKEDEANN